jgi:hypothetical protein
VIKRIEGEKPAFGVAIDKSLSNSENLVDMVSEGFLEYEDVNLFLM